MPSTIAVNFTNQAEVQGSNPPVNKSVSAKVLRDVLDDGQISGGYVRLAGTETITGAKTFTNTIVGSINGNAATVTNGVYTIGNQTIGGTKTFSSTIAGSIDGNAATVTNGVYTIGNQTIGGTKTFSGNLNVTGTSTGIIPVGAVVGFFATSAPSGWLQLNGAPNISKTAYAALWAHAQASGNIVTEEQWVAGRYGSFTFGDATNFRIPYTFGFFLRGWSGGTTNDAGRVIGQFQNHAIENFSGNLQFRQFADAGAQASGVFRYDPVGNPATRLAGGGGSGLGNISINASRQINTASETRPQNVPILYCIKF